MRISLREAHKLDGRIAGKIAEGFKTRYTVSVYDEEPAAVFLGSVESNVKEAVSTTVNLIQARAYLRRLVQEANQEMGINETISQRKECIEQLRVWAEIKTKYESVSVPMTADILAAKMAKQREQGGSDLYGHDSVDVTAISRDLYLKSLDEVRSFRRQIDECEDKLASLNAGTKIDIEDGLVDFLEGQGIL